MRGRLACSEQRLDFATVFSMVAIFSARSCGPHSWGLASRLGTVLQEWSECLGAEGQD